MKKIVSLSLAALAMAAMATPAFATNWAASIRGDVGATGSQVIFDTCNTVSDRDEWNWDFTARIAKYISCSPCCAYVAASWQGSNNTVHSRGDEVWANEIAVKNDFSKLKFGMGFDLFKNHCLAFGMEFGGNYLNTKLSVDRDVVEGSVSGSSRSKTDGLGLYTSVKGEYKFPSSCLRNWSIYGKAEVADIIGRQTYDAFFLDTDNLLGFYPTRYNNVVEIDLEAALVYSPCCKFWCNSHMNVALGVRTDSFVNLYRQVDFANTITPDCGNTTLLSLARPTLFLEFGLKM